MRPNPVAQRQLNLGPAAWFRPEPMSPPANQIRIRRGGAIVDGALKVIVPNPDVNGQPQDILSAGFAVTAIGNQRYDLVYLDATGAAQTLQGTAVAAGTIAFNGAPGFTGGPALPDNIVPVAYVLVDEPASVSILGTDIFPVNPFVKVSRDLNGYFVDKGLTGSVPAGSSQAVTAAFAGETSGGNATTAGVITTAPLNVVHLVDQNGDEIQHTASQEVIYGRLTFAAAVWTLSYFYTLAGVETAVTNMTTDTTLVAGLTNIRMLFTPKVFSQHDTARPLFASALVPLNGKVAGEIPLATTAQSGVVVLATPSADVTAGHVVQASDARVGAVQGQKNGAGTTGYEPIINLVEGSGVTITMVEAGGKISFTINATQTSPKVALVFAASGASPINLPITPVVTPLALIFIAMRPTSATAFGSFGCAVGTAAGQQAAIEGAFGGGGLDALTSGSIVGENGTFYHVSTFGSPNIVLTKDAGNDISGYIALILGY